MSSKHSAAELQIFNCGDGFDRVYDPVCGYSLDHVRGVEVAAGQQLVDDIQQLVVVRSSNLDNSGVCSVRSVRDIQS